MARPQVIFVFSDLFFYVVTFRRCYTTYDPFDLDYTASYTIRV